MKRLNLLAIASLFSLLFFCLAWELWLAPLRPGGSTLALKALPLLFPVFGLLRANRYTHQWTAMLALLYLAEGAVRVGSDPANQQWAPAVEIVLATLLFCGCVGYARASAPSKQPQPARPAD